MPPKEEKKSGKKRSRSDAKFPTHDALNKRAKKVMVDALEGADARKSALHVEGPFTKGDKFDFENLFEDFNSKSFDRKYRAAVPGTDELLSTSTIRSMVQGLIDSNNKTALTEATLEELANVINTASETRIDTGFSGFSVDPNSRTDSRMQHPSSDNSGIYGETKGTGSLHSSLDRLRKDYAIGKMEEETDKPNYTLTDVVHAGVRGAIEYTLNRFTAPVTAKDVKPYSDVKGKEDKDLFSQVEMREEMKRIYIRLGGTLEEGDDHSYDRLWGDRSYDAPASPFRDTSEDHSHTHSNPLDSESNSDSNPFDSDFNPFSSFSNLPDSNSNPFGFNFDQYGSFSNSFNTDSSPFDFDSFGSNYNPLESHYGSMNNEMSDEEGDAELLDTAEMLFF